MTTSPLCRIPKIDYEQIRKYQLIHKCSFRSAFEMWKKDKLGMKWQDY